MNGDDKMKFFCEGKTKWPDESIVCIVCILYCWTIIDMDTYSKYE